MGSLRGFSLLLLVTSLVFSGVLGSSSRPALCDVSCCSVLPTCDMARDVTCECPNMESMTLRKGDIPQTVQEVNIRNTRQVTIDKDAISGLQYLTSFTMSSIGDLEIKQDGMASQKDSELRTVTFQHVGSMHVESKAFSGVWQPKTTIQMHRIDGLYVKSNAFDYQVVEHGPSVSLQHVQMLNLGSNGFAAPLYALDLNKVTMDVCHNGSFHVSADYIFWNKVNITEAYARCFYCTNAEASVTIQSFRMKYAHSIAFSGNVRKLTIKNSHFITIYGKGLDFEVAKMELVESYIENLHSDGLHVLATDIRIEYLRIDLLRKNALSGLQMKRGSVADQQRLLFNQIDIKSAENGSLVLSETANLQNLQMTNTHVKSRKNPVCPIEKYARMLTDASSKGPLSNAQKAVSSSLTGSNRCPDDNTNINKASDSKFHGEPFGGQRYPKKTSDGLGDTGDTFASVDTRVSHGIHPHESEETASTHESGDEAVLHESEEKTPSHESEGEAVSHEHEKSPSIESEVKFSSHESEEPKPTETQEKVDDGAPDVADNINKKKQTQVVLTAVLPLAAVMVVVLFGIWLVRRRKRGQQQPPASGQRSDQETSNVLIDPFVRDDS